MLENEDKGWKKNDDEKKSQEKVPHRHELVAKMKGHHQWLSHQNEVSHGGHDVKVLKPSFGV